LLREGIKVVLAGQPNVGKSSLLNALAGAELAIVTPIAGTTRDKISQTIQIEGVPVHVTDTAGLREPAASLDEVERIGVARSWAEIEAADAVVFLHDLTRRGQAEHDAGDRTIAARLPAALAQSARLVHVFNKADVAVATGPLEGIVVSALTGHGLPALRQRLLECAGWQAHPEGLFTARTRHVQALQRTQNHLALAQQWADRADGALDLFAEELRLAHDALAEITGQFTSEDLLGEIFSRFCIGK
jgi:tRNA modification GTPase